MAVRPMRAARGAARPRSTAAAAVSATGAVIVGADGIASDSVVHRSVQ